MFGTSQRAIWGSVRAIRSMSMSCMHAATSERRLASNHRPEPRSPAARAPALATPCLVLYQVIVPAGRPGKARADSNRFSFLATRDLRALRTPHLASSFQPPGKGVSRALSSRALIALFVNHTTRKGGCVPCESDARESVEGAGGSRHLRSAS